MKGSCSRRCSSSYRHAALDRQPFQHHVYRKASRPVGQRFCCCSPLSLISTLQVRGCAQRYCRSRLAWQVELTKVFSDAVSPRVAKTNSVQPLVDCFPLQSSRATAAPQSLSTAAEPLPSVSWSGAGRLSYNRSCDFRSLSV